MERIALDAVGRCILKLYTILRNLIQSIKNALQEAKDYSDARGDYIVDQGTSGIWTYRKWASGIAECWGKGTASSGAFTDGGAYFYRTLGTVYYPSGLFIEPPVLEITIGHNSIASGGTSYSNHTKDSFDVVAISNNNVARPIIGFYNAKGLWKALEQVGGVILNLLNNRRVVVA